VAATPETAGKLVALGASVAIEAGAGTTARFPDADYAKAGATVTASAAEAVKDADIVLTVRRPERRHPHGRRQGCAGRRLDGSLRP